jgi:hypothetical protein
MARFNSTRCVSIDFRLSCSFSKRGNPRQYATLHKFLALCQAGFFGADRDRSGRLQINEVFTALAITNMQVSMPSVTSLYNNLAKASALSSCASLIFFVF